MVRIGPLIAAEFTPVRQRKFPTRRVGPPPVPARPPPWDPGPSPRRAELVTIVRRCSNGHDDTDPDMKRVVDEQRLGFVATVCADGTPNLSPKGTTAVWDDEHLVFANIRSPGTIANLRRNPSVEVNVVDPFARKGYRFKGVASVVESGAIYDRAIAFYAARGSRVDAVREVVLIRVHTAEPLDSPAYDLGLTEEEVRSRWERHFDVLRERRTPPHTTGE